MGEIRKLAAILVSDVVGFPRLAVSHSGNERVFPGVPNVARRMGHEANLAEPVAHPDDRTAILLANEAV